MCWFPVSWSVLQAPGGEDCVPDCLLLPPPYTPSPLFQLLAHFSCKYRMPNNCFGDKNIWSTKQACRQQYSSECVLSLSPRSSALQTVPAEIMAKLEPPTCSKCLEVQKVGLAVLSRLAPAFPCLSGYLNHHRRKRAKAGLAIIFPITFTLRNTGQVGFLFKTLVVGCWILIKHKWFKNKNGLLLPMLFTRDLKLLVLERKEEKEEEEEEWCS